MDGWKRKPEGVPMWTFGGDHVTTLLMGGWIEKGKLILLGPPVKSRTCTYQGIMVEWWNGGKKSVEKRRVVRKKEVEKRQNSQEAREIFRRVDRKRWHEEVT